jgi:hypothetical protein
MITPIHAHGVINEDDFPSHLLCPFLIAEPPITAVTFDIPDSNGDVSMQVFEESCLYRHIATAGIGEAFRNVIDIL